MKKFVTYLLIFILSSIIQPIQAKSMPKVKHEKFLAMQHHIYDTENYDAVWNSAIAVLYDSDFIIEDIDKDLGHIKAVKTLKARLINKKRIAGWSTALAVAGAYTVFSYGSTAYYMYSPTRRIANELRDKTLQINVNVNIEKINENQIQVRFLPVEKYLQNADGFSFNTMAPIKIIRIYKPDVYNEFFKQIENNML